MHNPSPENLDSILSVFYKIAPFIRFNELIKALESKTDLPHGYIISFDDGYRQNFLLLKVLDKYNCKAIFYVSTKILNTTKNLWFTNDNIRLLEFKKELMKCNYNEFLLKIENSDLSVSENGNRKGLNTRELKEMLSKGHHVAVHTENHPFLTKLTSVEIYLEVLGSYNKLRRCLGIPDLCLDFAYPDGDFNPKVVSILKKIGVRSAATIIHKDLDFNSDLLKLPRYGAADDDFGGFALFKQTRLYMWFKKVVQKNGKSNL